MKSSKVKKLFCLFALLLSLPNPGFSEMLGPKGPRPMEERLEDVRNTCLKADYSKVQCSAYESIHLYNRDIVDRLIVDPVFTHSISSPTRSTVSDEPPGTHSKSTARLRAPAMAKRHCGFLSGS